MSCKGVCFHMGLKRGCRRIIVSSLSFHFRFLGMGLRDISPMAQVNHGVDEVINDISPIDFFYWVLFLHLHEIVEELYFHCSLSVCVCLCVRHFLWTKFQPNGWTNLDVVFTKWLLPALVRTLLNLVTLGQRSRSQWRNTHFLFIILC